MLGQQQYLTGALPIQTDNQVYILILRIKDQVTSDKYPRLFAWFTLLSNFKDMIRASWNDAEKEDERLTSIIAALSAESDEEAEQRREKEQYNNFVHPADKRPPDEFYDLSTIEGNCIGQPVDISEDQDGSMIKYVMKTSTSKFDRNVAEADIVQYFHETRFDNGQLVDLEEKRRAKEKFEMASVHHHEHIKKAFLQMKKGEQAWIKLGPK